MTRLLAIHTTSTTATTMEDPETTLPGMACVQKSGRQPSISLMAKSAIQPLSMTRRKLRAGVPTTLMGCTSDGNIHSRYAIQLMEPLNRLPSSSTSMPTQIKGNWTMNHRKRVRSAKRLSNAPNQPPQKTDHDRRADDRPYADMNADSSLSLAAARCGVCQECLGNS